MKTKMASEKVSGSRNRSKFNIWFEIIDQQDRGNFHNHRPNQLHMAAKAGSHPGEVTEHTRAHGKSLRSLHVCWNSQPAIEPRTLFSLWDKHVKRTYFGQTPAEQQQQRE